jgi:hypothetical protein
VSIESSLLEALPVYPGNPRCNIEGESLHFVRGFLPVRRPQKPISGNGVPHCLTCCGE